MGCDIHAHLEIKIDGKWLYYSPVNINRNYNVFAKTAGVRNYTGKIIPISKIFKFIFGDVNYFICDAEIMKLIHLL